jgi:DNA-binding XRE family transcriptional regulator
MGTRTPQPQDGLTFSYSKLRKHRRAVDVTQRGLADLVGTNANGILNLEKGGHNYGFEWMVRAAIRLGVRIEDLFELSGTEGPLPAPRRRRSE